MMTLCCHLVDFDGCKATSIVQHWGTKTRPTPAYAAFRSLFASRAKYSDPQHGLSTEGLVKDLGSHGRGCSTFRILKALVRFRPKAPEPPTACSKEARARQVGGVSAVSPNNRPR